MAAASTSLRPVPDLPAAGSLAALSLLGISGVIVALYGMALLLTAAGSAPPGLLAALDPAQPASLPELWASAELAVAGLLPLAAMLAGARGPKLPWLAAVPLALLAVETTDLAARLVPLLATTRLAALAAPAWQLGAAKLLAWLLVAVLVSIPIAVLIGSEQHITGRRLTACLLLGGGASVALDLAAGGPALTEALAHGVTVVEELVELLLYTGVAAVILMAYGKIVKKRN